MAWECVGIGRLAVGIEKNLETRHLKHPGVLISCDLGFSIGRLTWDPPPFETGASGTIEISTNSGGWGTLFRVSCVRVSNGDGQLRSTVPLIQSEERHGTRQQGFSHVALRCWCYSQPSMVVELPVYFFKATSHACASRWPW